MRPQAVARRVSIETHSALTAWSHHHPGPHLSLAKGGCPCRLGFNLLPFLPITLKTGSGLSGRLCPRGSQDDLFGSRPHPARAGSPQSRAGRGRSSPSPEDRVLTSWTVLGETGQAFFKRINLSSQSQRCTKMDCFSVTTECTLSGL